MPTAVYVRPEGVELGDLCVKEGLPPGCLPIMPVSHDFGITVKHVGQRNEAYTFNVKRTAFPLGDAYAVTDYFCQGMSFGEAIWLAQFMKPNTGNFSRASLYVLLSRFRDWDAVRPLSPLYKTEAEKKAVVDAYCKAATLTPDLKAELARQRRLAKETLSRLALDTTSPLVASYAAAAIQASAAAPGPIAPSVDVPAAATS